MTELRKYVFPAFGLSILVIVLLLATTTVSQAVPTNDKDVRVVNSTVEPVPTAAQGITNVAGAVSVSNTPTVNVGNSPTVSVGNTPTVNVGNTPTVTLSSGSTVGISPSSNTVQVGNTSPIPVVFSDLNQPLQTQTNVTQSGTNVSTITLATVPPGKRLVIEFVTVTGQVPAGQHVELMQIITSAGGAAGHQLLINSQPDAVIGDALFRASQMVKLYADPGTQVTAILRRNANAGSANFGVTISGYFINL